MSPLTSAGNALTVEPRPDWPATVTVEPGAMPAEGAAAWASRHRDALRELVAHHGAVLVRGLGLADRAVVASVFGALGTELMSDEEAFAQREQHAAGVYSSATWPDQQQMCMHHELSYRRSVPSLLMFACLTAPATGGETALADAGAVLDALPGDVVEKFEREGWLLTRTFGGDIGPSVEDGFGTDDRALVEEYCRRNAIDTDWQDDGVLRTRQRRAAVVRHPVSGRRCWFNQVAFLSEWTMDPEIREFLVDMNGEEGLPFATAFGGGDPVGADVIARLAAIYDRHTVREPWRAGDLMLVDNLATAHSREPFEGPREVLVAMSDPWQPDEPTDGGTAR